MIRVTVNIENEEDLATLTEYLKKTGMTYSIEEGEYDEALEASLAQGLKDIEEGLLRPHEEVWPEIMAGYNVGKVDQ